MVIQHRPASQRTMDGSTSGRILSAAESELLAIVRGRELDDFSLVIARSGAKWTVCRTDRNIEPVAPELSTADSFEAAWKQVGALSDKHNVPPAVVRLHREKRV